MKVRIETYLLRAILIIISLCLSVDSLYAQNSLPHDIDAAKSLCDNLPLDAVEGIWIYPEDNVTVLILRNKTNSLYRELPEYNISIIDSNDARLKPGELLGKLESTAETKTFKINIFTESKNDILLKPSACLAILSNDNDKFLIKTKKSKFKLRLNMSLNRLLPNFWKIFSFGVSPNTSSSQTEPPVGMIKIYPSYDGNGSSKRQPRYL